MLRRRMTRAAICLAACSAAPCLVWAQNFTWTNPSNASFSNGPWSPSPPSWGGGVSVGLVFIAGATPYTATNDLGAPFVFDGATLDNGVTLASAPGNLLTLANNASFGLPGGRTAISSRLNLGTTTLVDGSASSHISFTGILTGQGALDIQTSGDVTLSVANQNTGTTTLGAGTLSLANDNALGTGALFISGANTLRNPNPGVSSPNIVTIPNRIVLNGGGLNYNAPALADLALAGSISGGNSGVTVSGAGALHLTAATNTFFGGVTLNSGTTSYSARLIYSGANGIGGGSVNFAGPGAGELIFSGISNSTIPQVNVQSTSTAILAPGMDQSTMNVGSLSGAGTILLGEFTSGGTVNLVGTANANTGPISFFSGVTRFDSAARLGNASTLLFDGGTVLPTTSWTNTKPTILSDSTAISTPALTTTTFTSGISVDPAAINAPLIKNNSGTLLLQGTATARLIINAGTVAIDSASNGVIRYAGSAPAITVNAGGLFADTSMLAAGNLLSASTIAVAGGQLVLFGPESTGTLSLAADTLNLFKTSGALTFSGLDQKTGAGMIYFSNGQFGTNTSVHYTAAPSGSLLLGGNGAPGTPTISVLAGSVVNELINNNATGNFATYDPVKGVRALTSSEYASTLVSGASTLNNVSLSSSLALTAPTTINSLNSNLVRGPTVSGATTFTVNSGLIRNVNLGVATLSFTRAAALYISTISSVITGSSVMLDGVTLSGANEYTGPTYITSAGLTDGASEVIPDTSVVYVSNGFGTPATWNVNGNTETVAGISQQNVVNSGGTFGQILLGTGTLIVGSGDVSSSFAGNISGSGRLTKIGAGTLSLSGKNSTYSNGTEIRQGVLSAEAQFVATSPTGNPSDFAGAVRDSVSADAILGTGSILLLPDAGKTAELRLGRGVTDLSRPITVGLLGRGNGTSIFSTDLDPNRGTPLASNPSITSPITLNSDLTVNLSSGTLSGVIGGTGSLNVNGSQLPIVTIGASSNTYTGKTSVINGSLYVDGTVLNGASRSALGSASSAVNLGSSASTGYAELSYLGTGNSWLRPINVTPGQPGSTLALTSRVPAGASNTISNTITLGATALNVFSAPNPSTGGVGKLVINTAIIGSGSLLIGGGVSNSSVDLETGASNFSGGATLTDGTLTIGADSNPFTGNPTSGPVGAGSFTIAGDSLPPTIVGNGHTLSNPTFINSDVNVGGLFLANTVTFNGERVVNVNASFGSLTLSGPVVTNNYLDKDGAGTLAFMSSNSFATGISVFQGSINFGASQAVPTLNIGGGTSFLATTPHVTVAAGGDKVLRMNALNIASGSALDLQDNDAILDYSSAPPLAQIAALIKTGYANQAWTGTGITSGSAAAVAANADNPNKTAIGFAEASALGIGSFDGQGVDGTTIVMRYTLEGDANLDGAVNALDFNAVAGNFGVASRTWSQGDFTYDSSVSTSDFTWVSQNFGQLLPAQTLDSVVPEPATFGLLTVAFLVRRKRSG